MRPHDRTRTSIRGGLALLLCVACPPVFPGCASTVIPREGDAADRTDAGIVDREVLPRDAAATCRTGDRGSCPAGEVCVPQRCGEPWHCVDSVLCTVQFSAPYCSCQHTIVYGPGLCAPVEFTDQSNCETGPNPTGIPGCAGATIDAMGNCVDRSGRPLRELCCQRLADCSPSHVTCDTLPPGPCPRDWRRSVRDGCWGPCVYFESCQNNYCGGPDAGSDCPYGTVCRNRWCE